MWKAGSASLTCPKWPLQFCRPSPQVSQVPVFVEVPCRHRHQPSRLPASGPNCTHHSRVQSAVLFQCPSTVEVIELSRRDLDHALFDDILRGPLRRQSTTATTSTTATGVTHMMPNWTSPIFLGTLSITCDFMVAARPGPPGVRFGVYQKSRARAERSRKI